MSDVRIFTSEEAADVVTAQIDRFRNPLRRDASAVDNFTYPRHRAELVAQIDLLNLVDETVREALSAPSRVGPPRPELAQERTDLRSPGNMSAAQVAWSFDASVGGQHRSSP